MEKAISLAINAMKKLRKSALALVIVIGIAFLFGCAADKTADTPANPTGSTTVPSVEATPAPTEETLPTATPTPAEEVLPTATPTPTLAPKTVQEVADELKNVKVSVDELMNEDVVYPTYFGAPDENLTNEFIKHASYFESFGIMDFTHAKALVAKLNYCYLNSDSVDKEKAGDYLSMLSKYSEVEIGRLFDAIDDYNAKNLDDQIVIGWGMIDPNDKVGKAVINDRQQIITKSLVDGKPFYDKLISNENYDVTVIKNDGSKIQLTGSYDDLNIAIKYADLSIQYSGSNHLIDRIGYSEPVADKRNLIANQLDSLYLAFSDPEHANVRRHGFDANDFYEEDLDKDNS